MHAGDHKKPSCLGRSILPPQCIGVDSVTVSRIDFNYRARLWSQERAREVMTTLMENTDILITAEADTKRVFGIERDTYEEVTRTLAGRFSLEVVAA